MAMTRSSRVGNRRRPGCPAGVRLAVVGCLSIAAMLGRAAPDVQIPTARLRRGRASRRPGDVRSRPAIPRQDPDREGRLAGGAARPRHHRDGPDGLPGLGRGSELRPLQQQRPAGSAASSRSQNADTGIMGITPCTTTGSPCSALAEAYGAVDERNLWPDGKGPRSIGQALELAVRRGHVAEEESQSAPGDTLPMPRTPIPPSAAPSRRPARRPQRRDRSLRRIHRQGDRLLCLHDLDRRRGRVLRRPGRVRRLARPQLDPTVVYAVHPEGPQAIQSTLDYLKQRLEQTAMDYPEYARYYESQALFQGDILAWEK